MNSSLIDPIAPTVTPASGIRLRGRVMSRSSIDPTTENAMFALLAAHFLGVDRRVFRADLAEKTSVLLLEDEEGAVRGFSTLCVYQTASPGRAVTIIYSGDTIVDRSCWGSPALARTWIDAVRRAASIAGGDVYWLLLTSGYRTYRFLPVFFREFYPRFDRTTPATHNALIDALAGERFGRLYDAKTGIVRFASPQILADDLVAVHPGRTTDAHVRFFLARNPGCVAGDELVCLTRIDDGNLTAAGRRMAGIGRG